MQRSEQTAELMLALSKAQGEFTPVIKNTKNYYGGLYAQLDAIVDAVRSALSKHGIAFYHDVGCDIENRTAWVATYLQFGEQWIATDKAEASAVSYAWDKNEGKTKERFDTQTISIVWTYFKRNTLQAITGIVAEEDSDAQQVTGENAPAQSKANPRKSGELTQPAKTQTEVVAEAKQRAATMAAENQANAGRFEILPGTETNPGNVLVCIPKSVEVKQTTAPKDAKPDWKARPYASVIFNGRYPDAKTGLNGATCFDTGLFDALQASVGTETELKLKPFKPGDKFINIADVYFIAGVEYQDGKPIEAPVEEPQ